VATRKSLKRRKKQLANLPLRTIFDEEGKNHHGGEEIRSLRKEVPRQNAKRNIASWKGRDGKVERKAKQKGETSVQRKGGSFILAATALKEGSGGGNKREVGIWGKNQKGGKAGLGIQDTNIVWGGKEPSRERAVSQKEKPSSNN